MTIQLGEAISFHQSCRSSTSEALFFRVCFVTFFFLARHSPNHKAAVGGRGGGGARLESARELRAGRDGGRNGSFRRHDGGRDVIAMSRMGCWAVGEVI